MKQSISALINYLSDTLLPIYGDKSVATASAWKIIQHISNLSKVNLLMMRELSLDQEKIAYVLDALINKHMPLDYLLGSIPFLTVTIDLEPPLLIPRLETEWWCSLVIKEIEPLAKKATKESPFTVLDVCTGSGCIALAIAQHFKNDNVKVFALDNASQALALARHNAQKNAVNNCTFFQSNLFNDFFELPKTYDLIVTNPPYISQDEYALLDPSVREWEDKKALVANDNGYGIITTIVQNAPHYLRTLYGCGQLWCEIGFKQGSQVCQLYKTSGFDGVTLLHDLQGNPRVVVGTLPGAR